MSGENLTRLSEKSIPEKIGTDRAARATSDDTVRTKAIDALRGVPWPEEFSFRVVKNKFTEQWTHRETEAAAAFGSLAAAYAEARAQQNLDVVAIVAGECVGLIHDRPSAGSIIEAMVTQARSLLERGATLDFSTNTANPTLHRTGGSTGR